MEGIRLLIEEHQNILKFTDHVEKLCCDILEGKKLEVSSFRECIDFGRNYADKQHHGKEEKVLFRIMLEKLGPVAEKVIRHGMLVEHDLGRYHMTELEKALDEYEVNESVKLKLSIITNANEYASLLRRHIQKEDDVVYTFAERSLNDEDKKSVDIETEEFEKESMEKGIQDKYLALLNSWK